MYGQENYGQKRYAETGRPGGSQEEYYNDLFRLVPEFVAEKLEMKELYRTQGYEIGYLHHVLADMISQCSISTGTWGLAGWESVFGIMANLNLTYEQRREILMARIRGQGTTTKELIKNTAAAFSGGDVDVIEDNAHSRFIVRFIGIKGIPRNMQGFINMLEEIKPAHLAYVFEYRYTVWNEIVEYFWAGMKELTWDSVRILKEE